MNEDEGRTEDEEVVEDSQAEWDEAFEAIADDEHTEEEDGDAEEANEDGDEVSSDTGDDEPPEQEADREEIRQAVDDVLPKQDDAALQAVVKDLYPEDIPNPLVDSDGDPIKSVSDMLNLVNPRTGEAFTYDEARAWIDEKTSQYQSAVQERLDEANRIVENNTSLTQGVAKVQQVYGKLLKSMPEVADKLVQTYEKTLEFTPNGNVKKAPVDILEFYNVAMQPYVDMAEKAEQFKEAAEKKVEQREKIKRTKSDRADLSNTGDVDTRSESDKEWDAAFREVLGK